METDNLWGAIYGMAVAIAGMALYIVYLGKQIGARHRELIDLHSKRADKAELLLEIAAGLHDSRHGGER
jgi:hypothetical protein